MPNPVEVRIEISGLALCFLKPPPTGGEDTWNVAFVCDNRHPLDFKHNGVPKPSFRSKGNDIFLCVEGTGLEKIPSEQGNFQRLLNLSDRVYGHGVNLATGFSKLNIERAKKTTDLVWLQVPGSLMDVSGNEDNRIMQVRPQSHMANNVYDCGKMVTLVSHASTDFMLRKRQYPSNTEIDPPYPVTLDNLSGGRIVLSFDNECRLPCPDNDFEDLYEFVTHKEKLGGTDEEVRFTSWAIDQEDRPTRRLVKFGSRAVGDRKANYDELAPIVMANPYGNCDPVGSDPPPGD